MKYVPLHEGLGALRSGTADMLKENRLASNADRKQALKESVYAEEKRLTGTPQSLSILGAGKTYGVR